MQEDNQSNEVKDTTAEVEPKRLTREELIERLKAEQEATRLLIEQHVREAVAQRFAPQQRGVGH